MGGTTSINADFNRASYSLLQGIVPIDPLNQHNSIDNRKLDIGAIVRWDSYNCTVYPTDAQIIEELKPYHRLAQPVQRILLSSEHTIGFNGGAGGGGGAGPVGGTAQANADFRVKYTGRDQKVIDATACTVTKCNGYDESDLTEFIRNCVNQRKSPFSKWRTYAVITARYVAGNAERHIGSQGDFVALGNISGAVNGIPVAPVDAHVQLDAEYKHHHDDRSEAKTFPNTLVGIQIRPFRLTLLRKDGVVVAEDHMGPEDEEQPMPATPEDEIEGFASQFLDPAPVFE